MERGLTDVVIATAGDGDIAELADVAARTFPLACPPSATRENIAAFIDENLSPSHFRKYLADPERVVLAARENDRMTGYAIMIRGVAADGDVQRAVTLPPAVELSKIYVLPDSQGSGVSAGLMAAVVTTAQDLGAAAVWLGVNQQNQRAQRFYAKNGFVIRGTKTFRLGDGIENDYVMVRPI